MERLKSLELSPETKTSLENFGAVARAWGESPLGKKFGANSGIAGAGIGAFGGIADLTAGAIRPFVSLGIGGEDLYSALQSAGTGARIIESSLKRGGIGGEVENLLGHLAIDLPKYAVMSALPGGALVGFGLDAGLSSAGRGDRIDEVVKNTAKGASLGALFKLSGSVGDKVGNQLLKPVAKIGTVTGGTFAVEKAYGATDEHALHSAIINGLFEASHSLGDLRGKFARVWNKGKAETVKIENDGAIVLYRGKENVPVDIELVLDPKDGIYKQKTDFSEKAKPQVAETRFENNSNESFRPAESRNSDVDLTAPKTDAPAVREAEINPSESSVLPSPSESVNVDRQTQSPKEILNGETVAPSPPEPSIAVLHKDTASSTSIKR